MENPSSQRIRTLLHRAFDGDASVMPELRSTPHPQLLGAMPSGGVAIGAPAVAKVLMGWRDGRVSPENAQGWALLMRSGYVSGGSGPITPLDIDYELSHEDQIAEALGRMTELGDLIDGTIDKDELDHLLLGLNAANSRT